MGAGAGAARPGRRPCTEARPGPGLRGLLGAEGLSGLGELLSWKLRDFGVLRENVKGPPRSGRGGGGDRE